MISPAGTAEAPTLKDGGRRLSETLSRLVVSGGARGNIQYREASNCALAQVYFEVDGENF
jgi:hypothetical protein